MWVKNVHRWNIYNFESLYWKHQNNVFKDKTVSSKIANIFVRTILKWSGINLNFMCRTKWFEHKLGMFVLSWLVTTVLVRIMTSHKFWFLTIKNYLQKVSINQFLYRRHVGHCTLSPWSCVYLRWLLEPFFCGQLLKRIFCLHFVLDNI